MKRISAGQAEWAALVLLVAVKLVLLGAFGPTWEPDWLSYSRFADIILHERAWLTDAGLTQSAVPLTLFRSMGYPLIVAAFRGVLGTGPVHLYGLVAAQIALSLLATCLLWRLAAVMLGSRRLALAVAFGHATGIGILYDQSLLSDSFYASLFVLGWSVPLIGLLEGRRPTVGGLAMLGVAMAYSCLLRGTGAPFLALILPPVLLWAWRHRAPAVVAVFMLPVVMTIGTVMAWNHMRTGAWTMTTGAQFVMIQPLVKAAARGNAMFDGESAIDQVARAHLREYEYGEVMEIVDALFYERQIDALTSARLHKAAYLDAWIRHPRAMVANALANFDESVVFQFFNPFDNAFVYSRQVTGTRVFPGTSKAWGRARQGDAGMIALLPFVVVARIASYVALAVLVVGGPLLLWRRWRRWSGPEAAALWLWAVYFGYTVSLCALHMVARFMPAVAGAGLLVAVLFSERAWKALRNG
jgi:hypothetical protein